MYSDYRIAQRSIHRYEMKLQETTHAPLLKLYGDSLAYWRGKLADCKPEVEAEPTTRRCGHCGIEIARHRVYCAACKIECDME